MRSIAGISLVALTLTGCGSMGQISDAVTGAVDNTQVYVSSRSNDEFISIQNAGRNIQNHLIDVGLMEPGGYRNSDINFEYLAQQRDIIRLAYQGIPPELEKRASDYLISAEVFYAAERVERAYTEDELDVMTSTIQDITTLLQKPEIITALQDRGGQAAIDDFLDTLERFHTALSLYVSGDTTTEEFAQALEQVQFGDLFRTSQRLINADIIFGAREVGLIEG